MFDHKMPHVDFASVNIFSNRTRGFSFVSHPENGLSDAYLEISRYAFTTGQRSLRRDGRWDWESVLQYQRWPASVRPALPRREMGDPTHLRGSRLRGRPSQYHQKPSDLPGVVGSVAAVATVLTMSKVVYPSHASCLARQRNRVIRARPGSRRDIYIFTEILELIGSEEQS